MKFGSTSVIRLLGSVMAAVAVASLVVGSASAQDRFGDDEQARAYNSYASGKGKSLSSAAREATGEGGGKVIGARIKKGSDGNDEYEIRVLRGDGRVIDYSVDASRSDFHRGGRDDEGSGRGRRGRDR